MSAKLSTEQFIETAISVHGDNYDYSKVIYKTSKDKVLITCKIHGDFTQSPTVHTKGFGCSKCGFKKMWGKRRESKPSFFEKAKLIHGDKYDYSRSNFVNSKIKVEIGCKEHGTFYQQPSNHLFGQGCPKCGTERGAGLIRKSSNCFIKNAVDTHGDKYDYSRVSYCGCFTKVEIGCKKHGFFMQTPDNHLNSGGCIKCSVGNVSNDELRLIDYIRSLGFDVLENKKINGIDGYKFDCIVETKKIIFEYNGVYWHSSRTKDSTYHIKKRKFAESLGYEMVSIWEDDFKFKNSKVIDLIKRKLIGVDSKIPARKTMVIKSERNDVIAFHNKYHIQEFNSFIPSCHYSMIFDGAVVAAASFDKSGVLHRYTIKSGISIQGGIGKMISAFYRDNGVMQITTFCDRDYFNGGLYKAFGFRLVSESLQLTYVDTGKKRVRRERFMKHKLPKLFGNVDMNKTEQDICADNKIFACYNSGIDKYIKYL